MFFRKKGVKYNNTKVVVDGITFDSKKEARRYIELKILEKAGRIKDLTLQPSFNIVITKKYKADFQYIEDGNEVVEDVKGFKTKEYITKRKFFKKQYPMFLFRET